MVCDNVLPLIDRAFVLEASRLTRQHSAPGVDKVTAQHDAAHLDDTLRDVPERRRDNRYVAPPVERVWIEKEGGKQRPRGTPCCEDTIVPRAVGRIVEAIVEQDVQACSHGFRKGHSPQQAWHAVREPCRQCPRTWSVDADDRGCFDPIDHGPLRACLQQRVNAGGLLRLIGTWRKAGVREAGTLTSPAKGTPQGGVASPIVANVLLHHV
jgi:retron-type reverse transcriptase